MQHNKKLGQLLTGSVDKYLEAGGDPEYYILSKSYVDNWIAQERSNAVREELESIKADWREDNAGDRIATRLLQIDLDSRLKELEAPHE